MADNVTTAELKKALEAQTDEIAGMFDTFMEQVDVRFNKSEASDSELKNALNSLTNTLDGFLKRLDQVESEQRARDAQFERLVAWAKKVSKKTGIPLEDL